MIGHKVSSISNYVATAVSQSHGLTPILNQHNLYFFDQNISKYTMCYIGATHISIFQIIRTIFYWTHNTDPDGLKNPWVPCIPTPMYMGFPHPCIWDSHTYACGCGILWVWVWVTMNLPMGNPHSSLATKMIWCALSPLAWDLEGNKDNFHTFSQHHIQYFLDYGIPLGLGERPFAKFLPSLFLFIAICEHSILSFHAKHQILPWPWVHHEV